MRYVLPTSAPCGTYSCCKWQVTVYGCVFLLRASKCMGPVSYPGASYQYQTPPPLKFKPGQEDRTPSRLSPSVRRRRPQGKRVVVSGSGNVAVYTVEKLLELGAVPLTMSDSKGYVFEPEGFTKESLAALSEHKVTKRIPLTEYKPKNGAPARPFAPNMSV